MVSWSYRINSFLSTLLVFNKHRYQKAIQIKCYVDMLELEMDVQADFGVASRN